MLPNQNADHSVLMGMTMKYSSGMWLLREQKNGALPPTTDGRMKAAADDAMPYGLFEPNDFRVSFAHETLHGCASFRP